MLFLHFLHSCKFCIKQRLHLGPLGSLGPPFWEKKFLGGATNRNSKIGLHYVLRHIPISLHAKFQGNWTIRLGEKR